MRVDGDDYPPVVTQPPLTHPGQDTGPPAASLPRFREPTADSLHRPVGTRPVSIPDDMGDRSLPKATGRVVLPSHIAWSYPHEYDLDDRQQLRCAYERVMTEGLDDDVRSCIDLDVLLEVWDELWLSPHVRYAWSEWLRRRQLMA